MATQYPLDDNSIQPTPGKVGFDIFGPMQKSDVRVGYIDPDRGYITGVNVCAANAHAKLNPGAQFILDTRDHVRFMNVNEVNNLTPDDYDTSGLPGNVNPCKGVELVVGEPKPPLVEFMGGGGVGAKGNPLLGDDGSLLGVHLVERGYGYRYPPLVDIKDTHGKGAGAVAYSILAPEISEGYETYENKEDIEDYYPVETDDGINIKVFCEGAASEVPYGYTYNLNGEITSEWDPTIYANLTEDLFRRRILEYQEYLDALRTPWFSTRYRGDVEQPSKISCDGGEELNPDYLFYERKNYNPSASKGVYPVQHPGWGGYDLRNLESDIINNDGSGSTNSNIAEVDFDIFVHVYKDVVADGLKFEFREIKNKQASEEMGRYGPDFFTIKAAEVGEVDKGNILWRSGGVKKISKKLKIDTLYEVRSVGSYKGKRTQQGLVQKMGKIAAEETEAKAGKFIFADLVASSNDNNDLQIGATVGEFTQENRWYTVDGVIKNDPQSHLTINDDGTWVENFEPKGHSTYDLFYKVTRRDIEGTSGVTNDALPNAADGAITQSFMNKYAISPVPESNEKGSDFADQLFTLEWDLLFPHPGEYTFIGQTDNVCKFYLDGELIADLSDWRTTPLIIKKTLGWTIDEDSYDNSRLHNVRLDLLNLPKIEDTIVQVDDGKVYVAADDSDFQEVTFDGFGGGNVTGLIPNSNDGNVIGDVVDVTFSSTDAADYTNKFHIVPLTGVGDKKWVQCGYGNNGWNQFMRDYAAFVETGGGTHSYTAYWTPNTGANRGDEERMSILYFAYQTDGQGTIEVSGVREYESNTRTKEFKLTSGGNWNNTITKQFGILDGKQVTIKLTVANANGVKDPNFGPDPGGIAARIYDGGGRTLWSTQEIFDSFSGGVSGETVVTLTRTETKTISLKSGVDYGCYFTSSGNRSNVTAEMTDNGETIAIDDLGKGGRKPRNNMVVKCSLGKWRSADGTDDWGIFGHVPLATNDRQILWSVPKIEKGDGLNVGGDKMQFNFTAQDGTHNFAISVKDIQKSSSFSKIVKVNTLYKVIASSVVDGANRMEQGPSKTPGNTGFVDGDFHQAWESKQPIGSSHKTIHGSLIGAQPATFIQITATKGDFKTTRKFRHPYIPQNISDFTWAEKKKGEGLQTYEMTYEYKVERGNRPVQAPRSTESTIKTKNVFDTATYQNDANRQLWRTNVYDRGGFLAKYGVCPFNVYEDVDNLELNDNPYAGDHKIIWNNINFPVSANYNLRVAVDDSVILDFEGPNETVRLTKNGFWNGKSTGDSKYTQWFDKGSYKLTAILTQKEGGRFGFKKLTEAEKAERRQRIFDKTFVPVPPPPIPTTSEVTFTTTSSAGYTNSVSISELGTLTRNASMTKTVEIGKNYNTAFASSGGNDRVRLKLSPDKRTVFMEDLTDGDFNDLVLTINGGKFKDIKDKRFLTYEGGMSAGSGAAVGQPPEPLFPSSPDDIKIKGLNPMALSVEIKVSYAEASIVSEQSWNQNPMGVAFNIRAPLAPPPQQEEPRQEGRCPRNPLWTTRFTTNSEKTWYPAYSKLSSKENVDTDHDWGDFMNQYAMSPVPTRSNKGTDEGGIVFSNIWKVSIPYKGYYTFRMCADDEAEFYIDGEEKMKSSNWKFPKKEVIYIDKEFDEIAEFEIRVKNRSTTRTERINEKVFSARDWVKEGGATDEGFAAGDNDPHKFKKVKFDLYSNVIRSLSGYGEIPRADGSIDVTFTSTHGADYTNKFHVVSLTGGDKKWVQCGYGNGGWNSFMRDYAAFVETGGGEHSYTAYWTPQTGGAARDDESPSELFIAYQTDGHGSIEVSGARAYSGGGVDQRDGTFKLTSGGNWNNTITKQFGIVDGKQVTIKLTVSNANGVKDSNFGGDPGGIAVRIYDNSGRTLWSTQEIFNSFSGGGQSEQTLTLTKAETKTITLKAGVDYGCYFTSSGNRSNVTAEMTENGTVIGIDDLGKGGRKPRNNMIVTCSIGKYRSADGTDDTGVFGHTPLQSNNKQILWSVPQSTLGDGIPDDWNKDGLRFVFKERGGNHQFEIRGDEVGNQSKFDNMWVTGDNNSVTKDVKLNTEYDVVATVNQNTSGGMKKTKCEQGLIKKIGRDVDEINFSKNLMPSKRGSYIFADVEVSSDNDDLQVGCTEGFFTAFNRKQVKYSEEVNREGNKTVKIEKATSTYDLKYKIEWEPPQTQAKNLTVTGTKKEGIVYKGPYLFSYLEKDWGSVMNSLSVACIEDKTQDLGAPNENILGTKTLTWTNVPFKHAGNHEAVFMADDEAKFYINNELQLTSKWGEFGDQHANTRSFKIDQPGNYDIKVEVDNTATHSNIFYDNPTGVVLEITYPRDIATYDAAGIINSDSWQKNPMGVSVECVPPPCPKLKEGQGQMGDVIVTEPGNSYFTPPESGISTTYPVKVILKDVKITDTGINYGINDKLIIGGGDGPPIITSLELNPFGGITGVGPLIPPLGEPGTPPPPQPGITSTPTFKVVPPGTPVPPDITPPPPGTPPSSSTAAIPSPTGIGAKFIPVFEPTVLLPDGIDPTTGLRIPSNQIIQVTDLVGLKQTGWYNGKEYYGAVFYKDGVRYAGYYETAGALIRVYSTKQESIDSQVTTPPSAILRQGTDVSSNDPRLNIPGTPQ